MDIAQITREEFTLFQRLIYKLAGISMSDAKQTLLAGRLQKRLRHHNFHTYTQYYRMIAGGQDPQEIQIMVDLLTTNETYFFREPKHFDFLVSDVLPQRNPANTFRIWSAASSTGEEAYTMAMLLTDKLGKSAWEIFGSDISTQVLAKAARGHYPLDRNEGIPPNYLKKYCPRGVRAQEGTFLIAPEVRERVRFNQVNLTLPIAREVGLFDVIFLRNVMIYFDMETKQKVVSHLLPHLRPGGYFIIGHSETLNGVTTPLSSVRPTIYRKP